MPITVIGLDIAKHVFQVHAADAAGRPIAQVKLRRAQVLDYFRAVSHIVERLWRSVKYEEVYLRAYGAVSEVRASIGRYLTFYNSKRPHSSLATKTPDQTYFDTLPLAMAA